MTAIKKNTKTPKSPAPATKAVATSKAASAVPSATVPSVALRATSVSAVKSKPVATTITARVDTGFGNALYVRGDGAGLSWDNGVPMTCVKSDEWQLTLGDSSRPITFKLLVNDVI